MRAVAATAALPEPTPGTPNTCLNDQAAHLLSFAPSILGSQRKQLLQPYAPSMINPVCAAFTYLGSMAESVCLPKNMHRMHFNARNRAWSPEVLVFKGVDLLTKAASQSADASRVLQLAQCGDMNIMVTESWSVGETANDKEEPK